MKHAPGPWAVGFQTTDDSAQIISADGQHLATVEQYPLAPNARLIAAAPELLEAYEAALECIIKHVPATEFAPREWLRAAIARATD